jgi:hypothetical protein
MRLSGYAAAWCSSVGDPYPMIREGDGGLRVRELLRCHAPAATVASVRHYRDATT